MFQNQSFKKKGAVAQLGERLDGIQKVVGSIPSSSTIYLKLNSYKPFNNLLHLIRLFIEIKTQQCK